MNEQMDSSQRIRLPTALTGAQRQRVLVRGLEAIVEVDGEMTTTKTGYKFITQKMESKNDSSCVWTVGEWKKCAEPLEMCKVGFHDCDTPLNSLQFVYGDRWFV